MDEFKQERARAFRGRGARYHMALGSAWNLALQWVFRLTGLLSTLVLARLLAPEDFGVVAMAMLFIGFITSVQSSAGHRSAIIRHPAPTRDHKDSAWTIGVIISVTTGCLVFALAPAAAAYFREPLAGTIMQILSFQVAMNGFQNIGQVAVAREFRFDREFKYTMTGKLAGVAVTIPAAFLLGDYRALIAGQFANAIVLLVASYVMFGYRPRLTLVKAREILSFSAFSYLGTLGQTLTARLDQFIIGRIGGPEILGKYTVAREVSSTIAGDTIAPANKTLFAIYSKYQDNKLELQRYFRLGFTGIFYGITACTVGLFLVSTEAVRVLLGPQWDAAVPFFELLVFVVGCRVIKATSGALLGSNGMPGRMALIHWLELACFIIVIAAFAARLTPILLAELRVITALAFCLAPFFFIKTRIGIDIFPILGALYRPITAAALMYLAVDGVAPLVAEWEAIWRLAVKVPLGAATFGLSSLTLWLIAGRPDGAEKEGISYLADTFRDRRSKSGA